MTLHDRLDPERLQGTDGGAPIHMGTRHAAHGSDARPVTSAPTDTPARGAPILPVDNVDPNDLLVPQPAHPDAHRTKLQRML
jgi:hypothetical protein